MKEVEEIERLLELTSQATVSWPVSEEAEELLKTRNITVKSSCGYTILSKVSK